MKKINKYNWDVACWGKENVWRMYSSQEAALESCLASQPVLAPRVAASPLPLYQPLQPRVQLGYGAQPLLYNSLYTPHR